MMRKLILEAQITIDGYYTDSNGNNDWQLWNWGADWPWDDKLKKYFTRIMKSVDCILLSRKMAKEGFISHWKQAAEDPKDPRFDYASKINETHKVVFSKTLEKSEWDNIDLAKGDLADEVNRLKANKGKDMIVYGGTDFVSALIRENLIDEYLLFINPVVIGNGINIFNQLHDRQRMRLIKATSFDCGMVVMKYVPESNTNQNKNE